MGVTKKLLYRGEILSKPRHRNLFIDMEENIHLHFRDLRIELSRDEFEDICKIFGKQSQELLTIIQKTNYQDGKLANANQDGVRIWTESQLSANVKYHPQRLSLEACSDGYHLHYRNFKLLIDEADFRQIVKLFGHLDIDGPCAATYNEVLELLEANDLDFMLDAGNVPNEVLALLVASYHLPKIRDIFKLIGFTQETTTNGLCYQGAKLKVLVRGDTKGVPTYYQRLRGLKQTERLVDFLTRQGAGMNPNLVNRIKLQVLDLYYALLANQPLHVMTDMQCWLYTVSSEQVIFPYSHAPAGANEAKTMYKAWGALLGHLGLTFIKPDKIQFAADEQAAMQKKVTETIHKEIASRGAVDKIYLMGSTLRGSMGYYRVPFVHGPNAKLGSDIDILVEIHPEREMHIPTNWRLINPESSTSGCAVYHITHIPLTQGAGEWASRHPHIPFVHHLVDAYLFLPSQKKDDAKNAFLRKFSAKMFFDRSRDGVIAVEGPEQRIARQLTQRYNFPQVIVEPMQMSTENLLYKVFAGDRIAVLKLFKVAGNYKSIRIAEHTAYEAELISKLMARGVVTAEIFRTIAGADTTMEGYPALLFEYIQGAVLSRPEYPLEKIGAALAHIHRVQLDTPMDLTTAFPFEDVCQIWLPYFDIFHRNTTLTADVVEAFDRLAPLIKPFLDKAYRKKMYSSSPAVHNHGDVTPKNVMINQNGDACFFDFNNCYYGPRLLDVLDGGFEFSLAEKYIHMADFTRFDAFVNHYTTHNPLTTSENKMLTKWITLMGIIKFTKEIRVLLERPKEALRRRRALAIAGFLSTRLKIMA